MNGHIYGVLELFKFNFFSSSALMELNQLQLQCIKVVFIYRNNLCKATKE